MTERKRFAIQEGETKYALTWALVKDDEGSIYLDDTHPAFDELCGTANVKITKRNGKLIADWRETGQRFNPGSMMTGRNYILVSRVIRYWFE